MGFTLHLQQLFGQVDGNDASRAAHTSQIVRHNVGAHFEVVDEHCRQRGSGVEQAAVDHQNVNLQANRTQWLQVPRMSSSLQHSVHRAQHARPGDSLTNNFSPLLHHHSNCHMRCTRELREQNMKQAFAVHIANNSTNQ